MHQSVSATNCDPSLHANHLELRENCNDYLTTDCGFVQLFDFPMEVELQTTPSTIPYNSEKPVASTRADCPSTRSSISKKKSVSFSLIEIRSHDIILGDHPCCRNLPISLGDHQGTEYVDIEVYESFQLPKRRENELRLDYWERVRLLEKTTGLTEQELLSQEIRNFFETAVATTPEIATAKATAAETQTATAETPTTPLNSPLRRVKSFRTFC